MQIILFLFLSHLNERLREYVTLSFDKRITGVLMSRYIPSNMEFFTEDLRALAVFNKKKFGNYFFTWVLVHICVPCKLILIV